MQTAVGKDATATDAGRVWFSDLFGSRPRTFLPLVGPVPEPGTLALLASGLLAFGGIARQRMK